MFVAREKLEIGLYISVRPRAGFQSARICRCSTQRSDQDEFLDTLPPIRFRLPVRLPNHLKSGSEGELQRQLQSSRRSRGHGLTEEGRAAIADKRRIVNPIRNIEGVN